VLLAIESIGFIESDAVAATSEIAEEAPIVGSSPVPIRG
jgi:hypothetical protein